MSYGLTASGSVFRAHPVIPIREEVVYKMRLLSDFSNTVLYSKFP